MRLILPFALAGGGSAAIAASMTRWVLLGPAYGPLAVAAGVAVGAAIGARVARWATRRDARAPLRLTGVWLVFASAVGIQLFAANRRVAWTAAECVSLARVPLVLSLAGCAIVFAIAVLDGFAENELEHLGQTARLDAGASWWLTHVGAPRPNARIGDLERARGLLAASRHSRIAIVLVLLGAAPTLLAYARFAAE